MPSLESPEPENFDAYEQALLQQDGAARFALAREQLGLAAVAAEDAEAADADASTQDFPARRSQMRQACGLALGCGATVALTTTVACFAVQEIAFEVTAMLKDVGFGGSAALVATGALAGCFMAALLIVKRVTDYTREVRAWRKFNPAVRGRLTARIAAKFLGKLLYLALLAGVYWTFHARNEAALELLEKAARPAPKPVFIIGDGAPPPAIAPAPEPAPKAKVHRFGSRDPLYIIDLGLHGLVLLGMGGASLGGLNWRLAFASPARRRRKLARVRERLKKLANEVTSHLEADPALLNDFTEDEKRLINRIYGRTRIVLESPEPPETPPAPAPDEPPPGANGAQEPAGESPGTPEINPAPAINPF